MKHKVTRNLGSLLGTGAFPFAVATSLVGCLGYDPSPAKTHTQEATAALGLANASVVISQVYGGGGDASAPFKNDFVELFNRGAEPVVMTGWSIQYASAATATTFASNSVTPINASLAPGQYLLVQMAAGAGSAAPLPSPDVIGSVAMSASGGKVALVNTTTGLACNGGSTPCSAAQEASIVDLVGYDGANYFETSPAPAASNTTAVLRKNAGCTDTNNNGLDFALGAPLPRSSAAARAPCTTEVLPGVVSTFPSQGAFGVSVGASVTVTFSEPVVVEGVWFAIACTASGAVDAVAGGGPSEFTLTPVHPFAAGEACTGTIQAANVTGRESGLPMQTDYHFAFTVALPLTSIHTIQGATHLSPLAGSWVRTSGIVTGIRSNGYYLEESAPDDSVATSEGIFVFTSAAPRVQVGDAVEVSGRVTEFRPSCPGSCLPSSSGYANLTVTEIASPSSVVVSSGNVLPAPVILGAGGRVQPTEVIEDDVMGDVESSDGVFDPSDDALDFYESLEGMRVQVQGARVVGPTKTFGTSSREIYVVGDEAAEAGLRTARGGVVIRATDMNPERLVLDNAIVPGLPDVDVGDAFVGPIVGLIDYGFANYRLVVSEALPAVSADDLARETLSLSPITAGDLSIAAFNVENLDPTDSADKFAQLALVIVENLRAPDILALEEVQDNDGAKDSGVVDASLTFARLIDAVAAAGGPRYQHRSVDPIDKQDGGEPGGNIRVGFMFRTDRGLAFVDRPGAGSLTANSVVQATGKPALAMSPGRIDPTNGAFTNSRKPLAGEFTFQGSTLFVIANHFNSKGGDQPLFGRFQPPFLGSQTQRVAQAQVVATFVSDILALDANANIFVLGDLNDFEFSAPLEVLKAVGLTTLIETLPQEERYTYVYEGNSQVLDHLMVSQHALSRTSGFDVVHVNAEFARQSSDHDPGVAHLRLNAVAPVLMGPGDLVVEASSPFGATAEFAVAASDDLEGDLTAHCDPASGASFPFGTTEVRCTAEDAEGNLGETRFRVTVQDTAAPRLENVPGTMAAFATRRAGAIVRYVLPTATDAVDGNAPVTCAPASGSWFAPGTTWVTCGTRDSVGNLASAMFQVNVTFSTRPGAELFLAPIKHDGSSVFKLGRTLPVRFALRGPSAGITDLSARLYVSKVSNGIEGTHLELANNAYGDSGNTFRYDPCSREYVFNLATRGATFSAGTWALSVNLGDGSVHTVHISLVR